MARKVLLLGCAEHRNRKAAMQIRRLYMDEVSQGLKRTQHEVELDTRLSVFYEADPLPGNPDPYREVALAPTRFSAGIADHVPKIMRGA